MKKETKRLVIRMLKEYPQLPQRIKQREEEIKNPISKPDENVGGGRAQNKPFTYYDNIIITLDEDMELHTLEREYKAISDCLAEAGDETVTIIKSLYMCRYPVSVQELVATGKVWCGVSRAYNLRDRFIEAVATKLKMKYL